MRVIPGSWLPRALLRDVLPFALSDRFVQVSGVRASWLYEL